jgi:PAS domain S-box-containing protein
MSFKQKLAAAFGMALVILLWIGVLSFRRTVQADQDQQWVSDTYLIIEKLNAILADLTDAETSQRGYLITGEESYLKPYQAARERVREDVRTLKEFIVNDSKQKDLAEFEPVVTAKLTELDDRIQIRSRHGLAALTATQIDVGTQYMDRLRSLISQKKLEEQRLLSQRIETAKASSREIKRVLILGNVLALAFLSSAGFAIHGELDKRSRSEETLRHSEERFRLLVSNVKDYAILMLDPRGHIVSWNDGAERIKGYRAEEVIGQHFSIFYPPEDQDKPAYELKMVAEQGRLEDEGWRVRKDGSRFWANVIITALRDGKGQLRGFVKVTRDMTERRQNEEKMRTHNAQLEAANKELEAFCYSVSHDLRAPLRGIDGFSQALLEENAKQLDSQGRDYLQRIRMSGRRMAALIDDLLSLSRVTRTVMCREPVDLSSMADSIAADLHNCEPGRRVALVIAPGLRAEADPRLLRIVMENLLGNSWKFTAKRETAQIEVGKIQDNGRSAYFVRDNGAGFDPKYAAKLFGAFQRLHGMNEFPGTGIGLATVQRIIHRHGGSVWADAELDHGATFYFTL